MIGLFHLTAFYNYLDVQQDILETCLDRGQLRKLAEPMLTTTIVLMPFSKNESISHY